ncbi:MAG: anthranilate phosphoribosyltransferase [Gammaproteobacteria bacterium]|jgi:anthranilate phosphoribosyltransferase|nr:anthranilate phosphoribosyltransferase [Gammaproteobacteria bacterium]
MDMPTAIRTVTERRDLDAGQMTAVMRLIMGGDATPAQIGGFLIGLRMKGETVEEIAAAAAVMRELATHVTVDHPHLVDIVGTGGDGVGTFNVSTASAMVVAAAGGRVAKHGNRSISSSSGSADLLEQAGVRLDLTPEQVAACVDEVGVGFMFAPRHHGAMRHAVAPRREMAVRTIFNVLGPLTNPAGAPNLLIGVYAAEWVEPLARVMQRLGAEHVLVVHSEDGLDEISIGAATQVAELKAGEVTTFTIDPTAYGISLNAVDSLKVADATQSLAVVRRVLGGESGPASDIVALNAGAALYAAGLADGLDSGVTRAREVLASGAALGKLDQLAEFTGKLPAAAE